MEWTCDFNVIGFYMYGKIESLNLTNVSIEEKRKKSTKIYLDPKVYGKPSDDISCSKMIKQIRTDSQNCGFDVEHKRKGTKYHFKCRGFGRVKNNIKYSINNEKRSHNAHAQAMNNSSFVDIEDLNKIDENKITTSHASCSYDTCPFSLSVNLCSTHDLFYVLPWYIKNNHKNHPKLNKKQRRESPSSKLNEGKLGLIKNAATGDQSTSNFKNLHSDMNKQVMNDYLSQDKTELFTVQKITLEGTAETSKHKKKLNSGINPIFEKDPCCCILCDSKRNRKKSRKI